MQRDLDAFAAKPFDLAIIGGGVIGAAMARDGARRGMKVALVEREDFACAASEAMSHLIHGGMRYLAQGQLSQVFQSLAERAIWRRIAPAHVAPQPFLMPLINKGAVSQASLSAGTRLFEWLGGNGWGRRLSAAQAIAAEPSLELPGLQGAFAYCDCRLDRPERLVLAMLGDAVAHGAVVANHCEAIRLAVNSAGHELILLDRLTDREHVLRTKMVANVTGPWAAKLAGKLIPGQKCAVLTPSKGIHIVTRAISRGNAIALSGRGEHGFVVPWGSFSLIGTTDEAFDGDLSSVNATAAEISALSQKIIRLLPSAEPFLAQPVATFAGVRALPGAAGNTYSASRDFALVDHSSDGAPNFHSVYGGKWTTARRVAQTAIDVFGKRLGAPLKPCDTASALLPAAPDAGSLTVLARGAEMAMTLDDIARRQSRLSLLERQNPSPATFTGNKLRQQCNDAKGVAR